MKKLTRETRSADHFRQRLLTGMAALAIAASAIQMLAIVAQRTLERVRTRHT